MTESINQWKAPSFVPQRSSQSHIVMAPLSKNLITLASISTMYDTTERSCSSSSNSHRQGTITMMPIGVPKVAYRAPRSQQADWVDIYNRLYRERIIFLRSEIDDELANQIIGVMLYLDSEDSEKPIYLYIHSPGESVISGLAMYDCMQHITSRVRSLQST
jgi:hypothetical protein